MIFSLVLHMMASNALYELEAKGVVESAQFPFSKTPDISLALAELYRDGATDFSPHMTVPKTDTKKSAYWYIEAAKADNEGAQAYLKTLIPDYEKKLYDLNFIDIVSQKIQEQQIELGRSTLVK